MRRLGLGLFLVMLVVAGFDASPVAARHRDAPTPTPTPTLEPTATPQPTPTPVPEAVRLSRLPGELDAIARQAPGRLGIAVYDPAHDLTISVHGNDAFPLASVFKLAVAVAVQRLADRHKLDLDARVTLTAADLRHGTSPIASAHPRGDVTLTYWELLRDMLVDSDNTACDYLLAKVGGPAAVEDTLRSLGIADVRIRKTEADLYADALAHRSFARGGDNVGTPEAIARLLEAVAGQRAAYLDGTTELMLDLSAVRTGATRFRAGLPPAVRLAHKTGLSDTFDGVTDATNDAGIFLLPDGRRVVVVALLAESRADAATRDAVLADVARTVYAAYAP